MRKKRFYALLKNKHTGAIGYAWAEADLQADAKLYMDIQYPEYDIIRVYSSGGFYDYKKRNTWLREIP